MTTAIAPGKMVLLGEYAVLRGAPALVAAVDRFARVSAEPQARGFTVRADELHLRAELDVGEDGCLRLRDAEPGDDRWERLRVVVATLEAVSHAMAERGVEFAPLTLRIDTSDFHLHGVKLGLGSSAAVAVALWGAAAWASGDTCDDRAGVLRRASVAHRAAQGGKGSGVDVAASTFGGLLSYRRDQVPSSVQLPAGLEIVAIWSGQPASTSALVGMVERAVAGQGAAARELDRLTDLATQGEEAVAADDAERLLGIVRAYQRGMAALGNAAGAEIVTPVHAELARLVEAAGGAYKPSGAGGGDLGVAFVRSAKMREEMLAAVAAAGCETIPLALTHRGLEVSG